MKIHGAMTKLKNMGKFMASHGAMTKTAKHREIYGESWCNDKIANHGDFCWLKVMALVRGGMEWNGSNLGRSNSAEISFIA